MNHNQMFNHNQAFEQSLRNTINYSSRPLIGLRKIVWFKGGMNLTESFFNYKVEKVMSFKLKFNEIF